MKIDPQIWLDKVRAVPAVGVRLNPTYEAASTLLEKLKPLLQKWHRSYSELKVTLQKDMAVKIERPDGFELNLAHDIVACQFFYVTTLEEKGRRKPEMTYQAETQTIETLADGAILMLEEVAGVLWKEGNRTVLRTGVVVTGSVDYDAMPPGFEMMMKHLASPWPLGLNAVHNKLTALLTKDDDRMEQCHHELIWDGDADSTVSYTLDWQRRYADGKAIPLSKLIAEVEQIKDAGFGYFGKFGMGELNYANHES